jgi:hypothetical protein
VSEQRPGGELEQVRADALAASGDLARCLLAFGRAGVEVPTDVLRAQQTVAAWLAAVRP